MARGKMGKQQRNARRRESKGKRSVMGHTKGDVKLINDLVDCIATKHNMDFNKMPSWSHVGEKSALVNIIKEIYEEQKKK